MGHTLKIKPYVIIFIRNSNLTRHPKSDCPSQIPTAYHPIPKPACWREKVPDSSASLPTFTKALESGPRCRPG